MRIRTAATIVSVALLLAACTEEVPGVASPSTPRSSSTPAPAPSPGPPGEGGGGQSGPAQQGTGDDPAGSAHVTGLSSESDGASVRVVVNLSGSGVPDWTVAYSEATGPDGEPVDIDGDAFLRVRIRSEGTSPGESSSRFSTSPGPVAEARTLGAANGYEDVLIGVRGGQQPFTTQTLIDPGRIVVVVGPGG